MSSPRCHWSTHSILQRELACLPPPGLATLWGGSSTQRLWSSFLPTPPNKIHYLLSWVCPEWKLLSFLFIPWMFWQSFLPASLSQRFSALFSPVLPSLSPKPWVFWTSHVAKQFKSSMSASFFTQPFLSAESSYHCFHGFPPRISREALTNLLVQIE